MISIRRQMKALLKLNTDDHVRRHTYTWDVIDPKHRLGSLRTQLQRRVAAFRERAKQA